MFPSYQFVNLSPADYNAEESQTSLMYASRVKTITNNASKNAEKEEVTRLKKIIASLKAGGTGVIPGMEDADVLLEDVVEGGEEGEEGRDASLDDDDGGGGPEPAEDGYDGGGGGGSAGDVSAEYAGAGGPDGP
jgi:hypothetical protein